MILCPFVFNIILRSIADSRLRRLFYLFADGTVGASNRKVTGVSIPALVLDDIAPFLPRSLEMNGSQIRTILKGTGTNACHARGNCDRCEIFTAIKG